MPWGDKDNNRGGPWGQPPGGGNFPPNRPSPPNPNMDEFLRRSFNKFKDKLPKDGNDGARGVALLLVIALLLWLSSGIYFVKADEQGVVLRFGEFHHTTGPGLNYHLPYPIETVKTPSVTITNHVEIGFRSGGRSGRSGEPSIPEESLMLTGDENIVDIHFEVQWRINHAPNFLFNIRNPEETVKAVSESAMREVVGKSQIATILAEGKLHVAQDTKKLIQETLNGYSAGIEIVSVNLLQADPPAQVIDAFRDVQTSRADLETARNQAEAYRNDILPRARGLAQQMVLEAEGYKQEIVNRAQGEAARFLSVYEQYKQSRDVTRKRMYLETMENILQGMNKVIIEGKNTGGVLPYLPLPELKPAARAEEGAK